MTPATKPNEMHGDGRLEKARAMRRALDALGLPRRPRLTGLAARGMEALYILGTVASDPVGSPYRKEAMVDVARIIGVYADRRALRAATAYAHEVVVWHAARTRGKAALRSQASGGAP